MRNATHILGILAIAATAAAGALMGPVEGVAVGCITCSLLCVRLLRESAASATPTPPRRLPRKREADETPAGDASSSMEPSASVAETTPVVPAPASEAPAAPEPDEPHQEEPTGETPTSPAAITPVARQHAAPAKAGRHGKPSDAVMPAESATPTFSFEAFQRELFFADDPWARLKEDVGSIRTREAGEGAASLTPVERFLARMLEEAGLFEPTPDEGTLPPMRVVRPHHSRLFYLRTGPAQLTYGMHLRILRIEAALNAVLFAHDQLDDLSAASMEDLYKVNQRLLNGICAQAPTVDTADWSYLAMPWQSPVGPSEQGEWAVRQAVSNAIESVRVPFRLEADFRSNVSSGDVAIEFKVTPARVFPRSAFVSGLGIVPTTTQMRRREASKYACRLALLLASNAFAASDRVRRVWVSAVRETPTRHECLVSGCIDRRALSHASLMRVSDPLATMRNLGVCLKDVDGILSPVSAAFYLEDERFCPPMRHDLWQLSERVLPAAAALSLGTSRVSGLLIHEELPRTIAADAVLRNLASADDRHGTQKSVEAILNVADATSDLTVWNAAERVMGHLVDGTLALDDPEALHDDLVEGDALTKAVERAQSLLMRQRPIEAIELLNATLAPIDRAGTYQDTPAIAYRSFGSFAERVLYNRTYEQDRRTVSLVPDSYLTAHLFLSALHSSLAVQDETGHAKAHLGQAIAHARRAEELSPLGASSNLGLAACLENAQKYEEAHQQLCDYLEVACHPQAIGFAYLRLASVEWNLDDHEACQACYLRAIRVMPGLLPMVIAECQALMAEGARFVEYMDEDTVNEVLAKHGIPLAPTQRTSYLIYDGATASVDAEVFPVARDLVWVLESLTGDDVIRGIRSSLEREPDA